MDFLTNWMPEDWPPAARVVVIIMLLLILLCCCAAVCAGAYYFVIAGNISDAELGPRFGEGDNEGFVPESVAIEITEEPALEFAPSTTPESQASPTPTATAEPEPLLVLDDPSGDVTVFGSTAFLADSYADFLQVIVTLGGPESIMPGSYTIDISMGASPDDALRLAYSYAISIMYEADSGPGHLLYQVHDGEFTIGAVDANNAFISGTDNLVLWGPGSNIQAWLPSDTTEFYLESFHWQQGPDVSEVPAGLDPVEEPTQVHHDRMPDEGSITIP